MEGAGLRFRGGATGEDPPVQAGTAGGWRRRKDPPWSLRGSAAL